MFFFCELLPPALCPCSSRVRAAAAPTSTTSSTSSTHNSTLTATSTTSHKTHSTRIPTHIPVGPPVPLPHTPVISRPGVSITHTHSVDPAIPVHTRVPFQNPPQSGQKPISIVFEVLGGLAASALLFGFIRCFRSYRKIPARDRIAEIVQRHQLQRELEELERNPGRLRRHPSLPEPAPPYFPRPPSYDHLLPSMPPVSIAPRHHHPGVDNRAHYTPVATHSPPSTPPMSERILMPTPAATPEMPPGQPT
jgi:hypothetical protein